jgi:phosphoglycerate dehydrogenase-like enzyme
MAHKTLFLTERGARHQRDALMAAPPELAVTILRQPDAKLLHEHLADAEFLISERVGVIGAEILASAPRLKMIERLGSLTHDIDLKAAKSAGVAVCYWPQRGVILVAEHLIMQMLGLAKRLREVEAIAVEAGDWGESRRTDEDTFAYNWSGRAGIGGIVGTSVGILGLGRSATLASAGDAPYAITAVVPTVMRKRQIVDRDGSSKSDFWSTFSPTSETDYGQQFCA